MQSKLLFLRNHPLRPFTSQLELYQMIQTSTWTHISQTTKMAQNKSNMRYYSNKKNKRRRNNRFCKWLRTLARTRTLRTISDCQACIKTVAFLLTILKCLEDIDQPSKTSQNKLGVRSFQESSILAQLVSQ